MIGAYHDCLVNSAGTFYQFNHTSENMLYVCEELAASLY